MVLGAHYEGNGRCAFTVWAPLLNNLALKIVSPVERVIPMTRIDRGYWRIEAEDAFPGTRYFYLLDSEKERPDPASRYQLEGVHGPSQVVDHTAFPWDDHRWKGLALADYISYELHVGTFSQEGTFDAIIPYLEYLLDLGVNNIELMPVAQFPGTRNWGYDGVFPYAVQNSYGGPEGLKRLVNVAHQNGIAVVLDVVYNHLGPEGNYLWDYGPYFTGTYKTPWGDAINFDGPYSDEVRHYFIENALRWITDYHIDALRIDAIHGIFDFSAKHFLQELGDAVHHQADCLGRQVHVIPESDLNDVRVINPKDLGGYGLDAQWNDDFHHALHTLLVREQSGYYRDFGKIDHLEKAFREGFVYSGEYSTFRKRRHGSSSKIRPAHQFVVFSQNHDQVGNRPRGERLASMVSFEQLKLAAGVVMLSPYIPLLFMGEEYGETAPFQYFVSHSDEVLAEAVRRGRKEVFSHFGWDGNIPDPLSETTFRNSKITLELHSQHDHRILFEFYQKLIRLRKEMPVLRTPSKDSLEVSHFENEKTLFVRRWLGRDEVFCLYNFGEREEEICVTLPKGKWSKVLDSSEEAWGGHNGAAVEPDMESRTARIPIHAHSFVLYKMTREVK
jgi:maltooligosyltrehalose trehalohydrolase